MYTFGTHRCNSLLVRYVTIKHIYININPSRVYKVFFYLLPIPTIKYYTYVCVYVYTYIYIHTHIYIKN